MKLVQYLVGFCVVAVLAACNGGKANLCDIDGDGVEGLACGGTDCNDNDPSISPDAGELCDDIDHNCDGWVHQDPVDGLTIYFDNDRDGYGDPATATASCDVIWGWTAEGGDCDDTDDALNPETVWYEDSDGDGRGNPDSPHETTSCEQPEEGYVSNAQDPDDLDPNDTGCWIEVTVGRDYACVLKIDGTIHCWGINDGTSLDYGQATPPTGDNFVQVTAGYNQACALDDAGQAVCWGSDSYGESSPPSSDFTSINCGLSVCCGLLETGTDNVECWGISNGEPHDYGQTLAPDGTFVMVSAGSGRHVCGIRDSGEIECWGGDEASASAVNIPDGTYTDVNSGHYYTCAVYEDGTGECWGTNGSGQSAVPAGDWTMIRTGIVHTCGLQTNGEVSCWGNDSYDRQAAPDVLMREIDINQNHGCGIGLDGMIYCWGNDAFGMLSPPSCN